MCAAVGGVTPSRFFQIAAGDVLMFGGVRCKMSSWPFTIRPISGLVDKLIGSFKIHDHKVHILARNAPLVRRLQECNRPNPREAALVESV